MARRLFIASWASLALALTGLPALAAEATVATEAARLQVAYGACEDDLRAALPDNPTVADGVRGMRTRANRGDDGVCGMVTLASLSPADRLAVLQTELTRLQDQYLCGPADVRPECEGLAGAEMRLDGVRRLYAAEASLNGNDPRLSMRATFQADNLDNAVGEDPRFGVSFLKLAMMAGAPGEPLRDPIDAATRYRPDMLQSPAAIRPCAAACQTTIARITALVPFYAQFRSAYQKATPTAFDGQIAILQTRKKQWDAYHFGGGSGRTQLPWELWVNSLAYEQTRTSDAAWPEPPTAAWIIAHPSVGLSLKDPEGADSNLVGVVELVGRSWWDYDPETQARKNEWGGSLVAGYQKRDNGDDWGYGALVRLPYESLNVVWVRTKLDNGETDDTFALTLDLSKVLPKLDAKCLFKLGSCDN